MERPNSFSFESEFLVLQWDPQDLFLFIDFRGTLDAEQVGVYHAKLLEFQVLHPEAIPYDMVVDAAHVATVTMKGRKAFVDAAKETNTGRVAIYGMKSINKALLQFVVFAAGRKNSVHVCNSREDAVEWLKKTRSPM